MDQGSKQKILFLPSGYLTIGLIGIFVLCALGGIIFLASKTSDSSLNTSLPAASDSSVLSAQTTQPKAVPNSIPNQATVGPLAPSIKPKATSTPKPSVSPSVSPSPTPSPSQTVTPTSTPTPTPTSDTKVVNLSIDSTTINLNQTSTVALKMDTGSDQATSAEIHITFDKTKLEIESFSNGSFLPSVLTPETHDNSAGTASITIGVSGPGNYAHGNDTVATITFKGIAVGTAEVKYDSSTQTASIGRTGNSLNSSPGTNIVVNP